MMLTKVFRQVDLDSLPCPWILQRIEENARLPRWLRPHERREHRFVGSHKWKTLGFKPEKLLDWRTLERRWYQLDVMWKDASASLWDVYRSLSRHSIETGGEGVVWVPNVGVGTIDVVYPDQHTKEIRLTYHESVKRLFEQAKQNPSLKPYVVLGDDLIRLQRYKLRTETLRRRISPYAIAWRISVECRLEAYAQRRENRLPIERHQYSNPCAFVFSNDDRAYLITSDEHGCLKWHDHVVHIDGLHSAREPSPSNP